MSRSTSVSSSQLERISAAITELESRLNASERRVGEICAPPVSEPPPHAAPDPPYDPNQYAQPIQRRPSCWAPPRAWQPSCWEPPDPSPDYSYWQRPRQPYDQHAYVGRQPNVMPQQPRPNPISCWYPPTPFQPPPATHTRRPTCWDPQRQSLGIPTYDHHQPRQPSSWDPPGTRAPQAYPAYDQPPSRLPSYWNSPGQRTLHGYSPHDQSLSLNPPYTSGPSPYIAPNAYEPQPFPPRGVQPPPHAADSRYHDPSSNSLPAVANIPPPPAAIPAPGCPDISGEEESLLDDEDEDGSIKEVKKVVASFNVARVPS